MNARLLEQIAEAVLYEGYILYPYRPSSQKNRRERFTFGRVYPECYSKAQNGAEPFVMQTQCLVKTTSDSPQVQVSVRFLHAMTREIGALQAPLAEIPKPAAPKFQIVPELRAGGKLFQSWHEAAERKVTLPPIALNELPGTIKCPFAFGASEELESIRDGEQLVVGVISRKHTKLEGIIEVAVHSLEPQLRKITVRILNHTPMPEGELNDSEAVSLRTFASTHTVLTAEGAEFVSLMDPPTEFKDLANACQNIGTWPVLVGDEAGGERDTMLSSPIILYDYPKIAPESAGPLFDGTEIDEMLTLRILTMTDEEKLEMCQADGQGQRLLQRTEALPQESLLKLHGVMRNPASKPAVEFDDFFGASTPLQGVSIKGVYVRAGDRVRIRPVARADVMDMALSGQIGIIEAVEQDLEKRCTWRWFWKKIPGKILA